MWEYETWAYKTDLTLAEIKVRGNGVVTDIIEITKEEALLYALLDRYRDIICT
jgi:hypothetical protein